MKAVIIISMIFFLQVPKISLAVTENDTQNLLVNINGCGTGWNNWLVPDSIPVLQCKFTEACNQHDLCYGNCEGRVMFALNSSKSSYTAVQSLVAVQPLLEMLKNEVPPTDDPP